MTDKDFIKNPVEAYEKLKQECNRYKQLAGKHCVKTINMQKELDQLKKTNEELQKDVKYWEETFNKLDTDVRAQEQNRNAMLEAALQAAAEKYRLITESILEF